MERETGFEPATSTLATLGSRMFISKCQELLLVTVNGLQPHS
jgi:hypothetical protein